MNYYDELIESIDKYIKKEDYDQAKALIINELNMVYVPKDVEEKLNEFLSVVREKTNNSKTLSEEQIEKFLKSKEFDKQLIACDQLGQRDIRNFIDLCDEYLKNKDAYINAKAILIDSLIRQEVNYEFIYVNDCSLIKFNPRNLPTIEESEGFAVAKKIIDDFYMKDPSKANIGEELLYKEALLSMPKQIDGKQVAEKIIEYIDDAFSAK